MAQFVFLFSKLVVDIYPQIYFDKVITPKLLYICDLPEPRELVRQDCDDGLGGGELNTSTWQCVSVLCEVM